MSKETAKKLIAEMQTNEELRAKIAGITDHAEMVKKAVEAGYDVTLEEMTEAEKEFRAEMAQKSDRASEELSADELELAAGGVETRDNGKEYGCFACDLYYRDQAERGDWCKSDYFCAENNKKKVPFNGSSGCPHHAM